MNVTEEDLRNNYENMETDQLVNLLAQDTLTEQAKSILNEVLNSRNIDSEYIEKEKEKVIEEIASESEFYNSLASRGDRFVAKIIDFIIASLPIFIASRVGNDQLLAFSTVFFIVFIALSDGINGQSIGKRIINIKVVNQRTKKPCTLGLSALRNMLLIFLGKIDIIFIVRNSKKRLGDSLAGTIVIKNV